MRTGCARSRGWPRSGPPSTGHRLRASPSTRPRSCCAPPACRSWRDAWPRARTTSLSRSRSWALRSPSSSRRPHCCTRASSGRWRSTSTAPTTSVPPTGACSPSGSRARSCSPSAWPRRASSCWWPPAATRSCPRSWSHWAESGRRSTTTRRSCPCRRAPSASSGRCDRLRGAPLLTGGRGRTPLDLTAAARLASGVGDLLVESGLSLIELNPVFVHERGAVAVDAVAAP